MAKETKFVTNLEIKTGNSISKMNALFNAVRKFNGKNVTSGIVRALEASIMLSAVMSSAPKVVQTRFTADVGDVKGKIKHLTSLLTKFTTKGRKVISPIGLKAGEQAQYRALGLGGMSAVEQRKTLNASLGIAVGGARNLAKETKKVTTEYKKQKLNLKSIVAHHFSLNRLVSRISFVLTAQLSYKAIEAIQRSLSAIVKNSIQFEERMASVFTILDRNKKSLKGLISDEVLSNMRQYAQGLTAATRAMYDILSARVPPEWAGYVLAESMKAAVAGFTNVKVAGNAITTLLNSFGKSASEAGDAADWLFQVIKYGKTTLEELQPNLGKITATANLLGFSMNEIGAAMATMTQIGIGTDVAITSLRQLMLTLASPTDKAKKIFDKYGISMDIATIKKEGFANTVKKLIGLTDNEIVTLAKSKRGFMALATAMGANDRYQENYIQMTLRSGAAQEAFEERSGTLDFQLKQLNITLATLGIELGKGMLKPLKEIVGVIKDLTDAIRYLRDGAEELFGKLGPVIKLLKEVSAVYKFMEKFTPAGMTKEFLKGVLSIAGGLADIGRAREQFWEDYKKDLAIMTMEELKAHYSRLKISKAEERDFRKMADIQQKLMLTYALMLQKKKELEGEVGNIIYKNIQDSQKELDLAKKRYELKTKEIEVDGKKVVIYKHINEQRKDEDAYLLAYKNSIASLEVAFKKLTKEEIESGEFGTVLHKQKVELALLELKLSKEHINLEEKKYKGLEASKTQVEELQMILYNMAETEGLDVAYRRLASLIEIMSGKEMSEISTTMEDLLSSLGEFHLTPKQLEEIQKFLDAIYAKTINTEEAIKKAWSDWRKILGIPHFKDAVSAINYAYSEMNKQIMAGIQRVFDFQVEHIERLKEKRLEALTEEYDAYRDHVSGTILTEGHKGKVMAALAKKEAEEKEALEKKYDKKIAIQKKRNARYSAGLDFAKGLIGIWSGSLGKHQLLGIPIAAVLTGLLAGVFGAQLAIINNTKFGEGGKIEGRPHSRGGVPFTVNGKPGFEAEGEEFMFNKKASKKNIGIFYALQDQLTKGKTFAQFAMNYLTERMTGFNVPTPKMSFAGGGAIPNVVNNTSSLSTVALQKVINAQSAIMEKTNTLLESIMESSLDTKDGVDKLGKKRGRY